jgi:hypothetical protein
MACVLFSVCIRSEMAWSWDLRPWSLVTAWRLRMRDLAMTLTASCFGGLEGGGGVSAETALTARLTGLLDGRCTAGAMETDGCATSTARRCWRDLRQPQVPPPPL